MTTDADAGLLHRVVLPLDTHGKIDGADEMLQTPHRLLTSTPTANRSEAMGKSTPLTYRRLKATGRTRDVPGSIEREYVVLRVDGAPTKRFIWIDRRDAANFLPDRPVWKD
jgi:hypothetical protein